MSEGVRLRATEALFARQRFGIAPGLDRIDALLARLDRPQDAFDVVLIAGTNGKGGTAAHLDAMLRADGTLGAVGRTTSPHLVDPGERIVVDGRSASPRAFEALAAEVAPHADAVGATFFETVTAMALLAFARAGVAWAVVEVGLGGRFDATNVLAPRACAVTQIALDHQAVLGSTLAAIAREKAGILRPGVPAWSSASGVAAAALADAAEAVGAPLRFLDRDAVLRRIDHGWDGSEVVVAPSGGGAVRFRTPAIGAAQARNAALAALLARELGTRDAAIAQGAADVRWPGRIEVVAASPSAPDVVRSASGRLVLDGAHNPAAASALADTFASLGSRPHLVIGMADDKDAVGVLGALAPHVRSVRTTRARSSPRAATPDRLAVVARSLGVDVRGAFDVPAAAVRGALAEAEEDRAADGSASDVLVAGSLYLVGEVRAWSVGATLPGWERWQ